jgi:hypothetical protein
LQLATALWPRSLAAALLFVSVHEAVNPELTILVGNAEKFSASETTIFCTYNIHSPDAFGAIDLLENEGEKLYIQ